MDKNYEKAVTDDTCSCQDVFSWKRIHNNVENKIIIVNLE